MIYELPSDIKKILENKIYDIDIHFKAHFKSDRLDLSNYIYDYYINDNSYDDNNIFNITENVIKKYKLLHPKMRLL